MYPDVCPSVLASHVAVTTDVCADATDAALTTSAATTARATH
jgi:hypothetical protein